MPPQNEQGSCKSLEELIADIGVYPAPAYRFVQESLAFTVQKMHGAAKKDCDEAVSRHVTGSDLCQGAREYASKQWGLLAYTVLRRWNITRTMDMGRIVFALIDIGQMQRTENDTLEDFRDVFDLRKTLEADYTIPLGS
jgi:uncharacterized repeat protein (TIGR04138 family)